MKKEFKYKKKVHSSYQQTRPPQEEAGLRGGVLLGRGIAALINGINLRNQTNRKRDGVCERENKILLVFLLTHHSPVPHSWHTFCDVHLILYIPP